MIPDWSKIDRSVVDAYLEKYIREQRNGDLKVQVRRVIKKNGQPRWRAMTRDGKKISDHWYWDTAMRSAGQWQRVWLRQRCSLAHHQFIQEQFPEAFRRSETSQ